MVPSSVSCDYRCKQQQKRENIHSILFSVPGTNLRSIRTIPKANGLHYFEQDHGQMVSQ